MTITVDLVLRGIFVGAGATLTIDLWATLLRRFGIPSLDFALLGRWIAHLPSGKFFHASIGRAAPARRERLLGWLAHYSIGIGFAGVLLSFYGASWANAPTLGPAMLVGVSSVAAPLFVLQPALGAGVASSKTPRPVFNTAKSLTTHTVFGVGLFLAASLAARLFPHLGEAW
jgi:Protein of unknown function (DUF2938)